MKRRKDLPREVTCKTKPTYKNIFLSSSPCSLNPKPKSSVLDSRSTCTKNPQQPLIEHKSSVLDLISLVEIEPNKLEMLIC